MRERSFFDDHDIKLGWTTFFGFLAGWLFLQIYIGFWADCFLILAVMTQIWLRHRWTTRSNYRGH